MEQWAIVEMTSSDRKRKSLEACDSVCDKGKGVMEEPPDLGILHIQQRQSEGGLLIIEASTPILLKIVTRKMRRVRLRAGISLGVQFF